MDKDRAFFWVTCIVGIPGGWLLTAYIYWLGYSFVSMLWINLVIALLTYPAAKRLARYISNE